jgi:hypothetical protein
MIILSVRHLAAATLATTLLGVSAYADPITVDWDVVPHNRQQTGFDGSPYYNCVGEFYGERGCRWLWDTGMQAEAVFFSFFDDKYFDGFGIGVPEADLPEGNGGPEGAVMRIRPECKSELSPCFDLFTPQQLRIVGGNKFGSPFPNLFITSSRGGLMKFPSVNGLLSIEFSGDEWSNLEWLEYGFYLPEACESDDPPQDDLCRRGREKDLTLRDLTFEPVPEPALVSLLTVGALGVGVRRRFRSS